MLCGVCKGGWLSLGARPAHVAEYVLAIVVEAHDVQADGRHDLLGTRELAVAAEDGGDEFDARLLAHDDLAAAALAGGALALGTAPHELLAALEELLHAGPEMATARRVVLDDLALVAAAQARDSRLGAAQVAAELDEQQPQLAGHIGDRRIAVVVEGPVIDPLA